jgi:hypothetical protein
MSPAESFWWKSRLREKTNEELSPLVNLGSSTAKYRETTCPYIDGNIFEPLRRRGIEIVHVDSKIADGVDLAGDITSPDTQQKILALKPKALLCNNLLEHVKNRNAVCAGIKQILPAGGYAFVSVPYHYPYHPDPIDTGFRPSVDQLSSLFPGFKLQHSDTVEFGNYFEQLLGKPKLLLRDAYMITGGLFKRDRWRVLRANYRYLRKSYSVTCVLLQKMGAI